MSGVVGLQHLVVPGQVIAVSKSTGGGSGGGDEEPPLSSSSSSFLRGHGTYIETSPETGEERLVAAVCGTVLRVNKLVSVRSVASTWYDGQVGDLVVGRVVSVQSNRWKVRLTPGGTGRDAALPLSGVHLPGGAQRVRTSEDARKMRDYLQEGDLVSAEVHKVQQDGTLMLHTRSIRYGKLENGWQVSVPPALVVRRKNHSTVLMNKFLVLWGCNGIIWLQRKMNESSGLEQDQQQEQQQRKGGSASGNVAVMTEQRDLAELQEAQIREHAQLPYTVQERCDLARLVKAVECLGMIHAQVTPESVQEIYQKSLDFGLLPARMILPNNVLRLTDSLRRQ